MDIQQLANQVSSYDDLIQQFKLEIPDDYNMAANTVGHWARATPDKPALIFETAAGEVSRYTFAELEELAQRLAGGLQQLGMVKGDRIAILMPQARAVGLSHLAIYKLGAIAVTISFLYGTDTIHHVLADSETTAIVVSADLVGKIRAIRPQLPHLRQVIVVGEGNLQTGELAFENLLQHEPLAEPVSTQVEDPALLLYTSGSTGRPKGVLHAHRVLAAYEHTIKLTFNLEVTPDSLFFTPADWAWVGGLLDTLLPGWAYGVPVLGYGGRFQPRTIFDLMARYGVTHSFMPPTALKQLAQVPNPRDTWDLKLRVISTGGEPLPAATLTWLERELDVAVIEFYGLSECNHLVGNCRRVWPVKPGSMGRAYPAHQTTLIDDQGQPVPQGEVGQIAAHRSDPTLFLGYWNLPEATAQRFMDDWVLTGDLAYQDEDGYFFYQGRVDDLIKSSGYRIGPNEVEECLMGHPAVAEAAVVGSPDRDRTQIVKAFVRLAAGYNPSTELTRTLQQYVKDKLAAFKSPREVEYVDSFPLTSSGKIRRSELRQREIERKRK